MLNPTLVDLPSLTSPRVRSYAEASARLDARREAALRIASSTLDAAGLIASHGDADLSDRLIAEARDYLAEVHAIDALRAS